MNLTCFYNEQCDLSGNTECARAIGVMPGVGFGTVDTYTMTCLRHALQSLSGHAVMMFINRKEGYTRGKFSPGYQELSKNSYRSGTTGRGKYVES